MIGTPDSLISPAKAAAIFTAVALVLGIAGLAVSGMVGTEQAGFFQVLEVAYRRAWGIEYVADSDRILSELRLPRGVLAMLVGASLAPIVHGSAV